MCMCMCVCCPYAAVIVMTEVDCWLWHLFQVPLPPGTCGLPVNTSFIIVNTHTHTLVSPHTHTHTHTQTNMSHTHTHTHSDSPAIWTCECDILLMSLYTERWGEMTLEPVELGIQCLPQGNFKSMSDRREVNTMEGNFSLRRTYLPDWSLNPDWLLCLVRAAECQTDSVETKKGSSQPQHPRTHSSALPKLL